VAVAAAAAEATVAVWLFQVIRQALLDPSLSSLYPLLVMLDPLAEASC
jgi:hypothetical protein